MIEVYFPVNHPKFYSQLHAWVKEHGFRMARWDYDRAFPCLVVKL